MLAGGRESTWQPICYGDGATMHRWHCSDASQQKRKLVQDVQDESLPLKVPTLAMNRAICLQVMLSLRAFVTSVTDCTAQTWTVHC